MSPGVPFGCGSQLRGAHYTEYYLAVLWPAQQLLSRCTCIDCLPLSSEAKRPAACPRSVKKLAAVHDLQPEPGCHCCAMWRKSWSMHTAPTALPATAAAKAVQAIATRHETANGFSARGAHRRLKLSGSFMMSTSRRPAMAGSSATSATCGPVCTFVLKTMHTDVPRRHTPADQLRLDRIAQPPAALSSTLSWTHEHRV